MDRPTQSELAVPVGPSDHVRGSQEAPVTLVEYGDFECPYCGKEYPILKELMQRAGNEIRFVFRNFPLDEHPHAEIAAEAAEAAGAQGKFWDMHDMLFEHQDALEPHDLMQYARDLGLDVERFRRELHGATWAKKVQQEEQSGDASGVPGTPTFFLNGRMYEGGYDLESLLSAVRSTAQHAHRRKA